MENIIQLFSDFILVLSHALALFMGSSFGLVVPDIDHNLPFIKHRSIWTHGPFWPLIIYFEPINTSLTAYFLIGFFIAYAIHLVFDMYPNRWQGIAKIHLWGERRFSGPTSYLWMMSGVLFSLFLVLGTLTQHPYQYLIILAITPFLLLGKWDKEERVIIPSLTFAFLCLLIISTSLSLPDLYRDLRDQVVQAADWETSDQPTTQEQ